MRLISVVTIRRFITVYRSKRFVRMELALCDMGQENTISSAMQGYLVDWDAQKAIWDALFSPEVLGVST